MSWLSQEKLFCCLQLVQALICSIAMSIVGIHFREEVLKLKKNKEVQ